MLQPRATWSGFGSNTFHELGNTTGESVGLGEMDHVATARPLFDLRCWNVGEQLLPILRRD